MSVECWVGRLHHSGVRGHSEGHVTGGEGAQAMGRAAEALGEPTGWRDRGWEASAARVE